MDKNCQCILTDFIRLKKLNPFCKLKKLKKSLEKNHLLKCNLFNEKIQNSNLFYKKLKILTQTLVLAGP